MDIGKEIGPFRFEEVGSPSEAPVQEPSPETPSTTPEVPVEAPAEPVGV